MGSKKKKYKKRIPGAILLILIYIVSGALLPFIRLRQVSGQIPAPESFYAEEGTLSGDRAAVIESNKEALSIRLAMFEEAQESIVMSTFDIREGESSTDIFAALEAAADRGVRVQILVDGMYGMLHMGNKSMFRAAGGHENIQICFYNPPSLLRPWTINGRMHDKYIIVDDKLLLMGGRNTFDYFLGEYEGEATGYDREVLIWHEKGGTKTVITQVKEYFNHMWQSSVCKPVFQNGAGEKETESLKLLKARYEELEIQGVDWMERTVPIQKATFISNPTHIYGKEPYVWETLAGLMQQAEERVVIHTPYAVFSDQMYEDMKEIVMTVPRVELILNSIGSGDNVCASSDYLRNKQKLVDTGMRLYEYMGAWSTHGKSLLIDHDISVIGSYNMDNRSTYVDTETMLVIHSRELNAELEKRLEDLKEMSLAVDAEGNYVEKEGVEIKEIPAKKNIVITALSCVLWLVRYLI